MDKVGEAVRDFGRTGPIKALADINLDDQARSEFVSIVGPSGCGKSTLLKCVAGLQPITAGPIRVKNETLWLPPDNMASGLPARRSSRLAHRSGQRAHPRPNFAACGVRITDQRARICSDIRPGRLRQSFSVGIVRRHAATRAICRALMVNPELLLMDEPFGALDAMTRDDLNIELERLWFETRKTIIFITHGIDEAVYLARPRRR